MSDTPNPDGQVLPGPDTLEKIVRETREHLATATEIGVGVIPIAYVQKILARIDAIQCWRNREAIEAASALDRCARLGGADATIHAAETALLGVRFRPTNFRGIEYYYAEDRLYVMRNSMEEFASYAFVHTDSPEKAGRYMRDHGGWIDTDPEIHTLQNLVDASEDYVVFLVTVPSPEGRKEIRFAKSETVRTLDREEDDESEKLQDIRRILPEPIDKFYVTLNKTWNGYEPVVAVLLKHTVPEVGNHE